MIPSHVYGRAEDRVGVSQTDVSRTREVAESNLVEKEDVALNAEHPSYVTSRRLTTEISHNAILRYSDTREIQARNFLTAFISAHNEHASNPTS